MAITQALCSSFKVELGLGLHDFTASTGDVFKMALFTSSATLGAGTTVYDATNEVTGTGYTAGGEVMTNITPVLSGSTAIFDFDDVVWTAATFTARGALIYNSTNGDRAVMVLDFGSNKTSTAGDFTVIMPAADASNAILRIA
jgi:hypothetical protein